MTNFAYLLDIPAFAPFASVADSAERILPIDRAACALNCRRAMESAVKWLYTADTSLGEPQSDSLVTLMNDDAFRALVGTDIWQRMDYVRRMGNQAAHDGTPVTREQAVLCLENLFVFLDFIAYCYAGGCGAHEFDASLLQFVPTEDNRPTAGEPAFTPPDMSALMEENRALREQLTATREKKAASYVRHPLELSEYQTRKLYVDTMLTDAGWIEGQDWLDEVGLGKLPDGSGNGTADYLLMGSDKKPLAVIEAKKTSESVGQGRKRALLYADVLEKKHGRRPVVFLTNGFETHIIDGEYPERDCSGIWSKKDLERLFELRRTRGNLKKITVSRELCDRPYQKSAVKAVIKAFADQKRRRALVTMAPGAGKTRMAMGLCDVLSRKHFIRRVLFLAERDTLATQAARAFSGLMPGLSYANLCTGDGHADALYVFSTCDALFEAIDNETDGVGRRYTAGSFDLIVCDEADRSHVGQYREILSYFDAPLVGMTAAPEKEIDNELYEFYGLNRHFPTYAYSLSDAVRDGWLADYVTVGTTVSFPADAAGREALDRFLSDEETIRAVLDDVMTKGLRTNGGRTLGKTILFVRDRAHARQVLEVFRSAYPELEGFAAAADSRDPDVQSVIDAFSDPQSGLRLAVSADMLDTGVDVPAVLNLAFLRRVSGKGRFWQMIGRGTRLCPDLVDGKDKERFCIFDFCGNFEAFRVGRAPDVPANAAGTLFSLRARMIRALRNPSGQTAELSALRRSLITDLSVRVQALDRDSFSVRSRLKYVEEYSAPERYESLTAQDVTVMERELSPIMEAKPEDRAALRLDTVTTRLMLARLNGAADERAEAAMTALLTELSASVKDDETRGLVQGLLVPGALADADVTELENARKRLRSLTR
ncbi:MAG: DEAD/DEAH box helicase family protein [Clostridia bacterium]|nr:DEAD/DEAH box helicase family protein [Clostridia bacterium]